MESPSRDAGLTEFLPCDIYALAPDGDGFPDEDCATDPECPTQTCNAQKHPIDLDGNARVLGAMCEVDQGAYEVQPTLCVGDIDNNGVVDVFDLLELLACWGPVEPGCEAADIDENGVVDVFDLLELLAAWGPCDPSEIRKCVPMSYQECADRYWGDWERYDVCVQWVAEREQYLEE